MHKSHFESINFKFSAQKIFPFENLLRSSLFSRTLRYVSDTNTIFFVGKPGCGKGTQAKLLSEYTGWPVISAGHQFRNIAEQDTPVGRKVKGEIDAGMLAPHWFAMYLYQKSLFKIPEGTNAIFDGFNRKVAESELIVDSMLWLGRTFSVVHIMVPDEIVRARLDVRKETSGRADDERVTERLREYYTYTEPAIEVFRTAGALVDVDGTLAPEEIAKVIREKLKLT